LDPLCVLVAGALRATLPTEFTLAWEHSVQKTQWEERYRADAGGLNLVEARIQGSGAGMEPPSDAELHDGWWVWQPMLRVDRLRLTVSTHARDYRICRDGSCTSLSRLAGPVADGGAVTIEPCVPADAPAHR
jgi:hypothetical protein